jgi:hypothetical protein
MKISVAHDLSVADAAMRRLSVSTLRRELSASHSEEIPLYGGGIRVRESWPERGISILRDDQEEALCVFIDPAIVEVVVFDEALPIFEAAFLKRFPGAQRGIGHSYTLFIESWRLTLDFARPKKRRGVGSSVRHLSRVIIGAKTEPNQSSESKCMAHLKSSAK